MAVAYNLVNSAGKKLLESNPASRTNYAGTSGVETIHGTDGANYFAATSGADTLIGGKGDDIYCVGVGDIVIEKPGEGIDTVYSYVSDYTLADNVENMYVAVKDSFGLGNALDNFIKGGDGSQTLDGGAGNDILMGGAGADTFVIRVGNGSDVINDFSKLEGDVVRLDGYGLYDFSQVQTRLKQSGTDVVLQLSSAETLTFKDIKVADLDAKAFLLPKDLSNLKLTFADEFNGTSLNTYDKSTGQGTWKNDLGYGGGKGLGGRTLSGNGELQVYMDPAFKGSSDHALGVNPFSFKDGKLVITATEASQSVSDNLWGYDYTSGLISSKGTFSQEYGYFEMRADLPDADGAWPAFWLLPADGSWPPEIDIFEGLGDSSNVHMTEHSKATGSHTHDGSEVHVYDSADGFHTYGVLWTAETLTWYIDGAAVKTVATPADMHKPMYLIANMAVGGWAGAPEDDFNAQMSIDYIRVYSLEQAPAEQLLHPATNSSGTAATPAASAPAASAPVATVPTPAVAAPETVKQPAAVTVQSTIFVDTAGNDTFTLKTDQDSFSGVGGGIDTVNSAFSWTLKAGLENLVLTGAQDLTGKGNSADNKITGNAGRSTLYGLDGNDTLIAGTGATKMVGGTGNDTYIVSHSDDVIVELADEGIDSVQTSVSYTLSANVENMTMTGLGDLIGKGNAGDNRIIGNAGKTTLYGMDGNDTLIAGTGVTKMVGGTGNDVYIVSHTDDVIVENAGEGTDSVQAGVSYTLSANVENMSLTGTGNINGTGNELANRIVGNDANNILWGMAGNDFLVGGKGDDKLYGGSGADVFVFKPGDGRDYIMDFSAKENDKIDLTALHAKASAIISQIGADAVINLGDGQSITVLNQLATDKDFLSHIMW